MSTRIRFASLAVAIAAVGSVGVGAAVAKGKAKATKQSKFVGVHPIPKTQGGGLCHIEAPHVHIYAPTDVKVQYRVHDDHYYFVGDPVAYGWEGPRHTYYGHHPVHVDVAIGEPRELHHTEYCYLDGAHYHQYEPPSDVKFEVKAGAYWYVDEPAPAYLEARATLDPIDVVYEPIVYERPVVVVEEPPPAWVGVRFAVVAPAVEVAAPVVEVRDHRGHGHGHAHGHVGVGVEVVAPSLSIEVGVPAVVVGGHVHGHSHGHYKHKKHKKGRGHWKRRGKGHWKH